MPSNTLGEYLSKLDKSQLRIAETKPAHVTFFSGGRRTLSRGASHSHSSPDVATWAATANERRSNDQRLVQAIHSGKYAHIVCN